MPSVYVQMSKISNAAGRSNYLNDKDRQEEIVLHESRMVYSWKEHAAFEKQHQKSSLANNEARELIIKLPNELDMDRERLKEICSCLAESLIGSDKDYEYAVHWNRNRTNLHVHILFSERESQLNLEPKVYKKDIWQDKDSHKLAKAGAENAVLVHRKGDVQLDKDGNIKYQADILKAKDTRFKSKGWLREQHYVIQKVMKQYGYDLDVYEYDSPYLAQKKLYKGASKDYLEKAKEWNTEVKRYNDGVKQHIELEPDQVSNYLSIKQEVIDNVREANSDEKKITPRAIELVHDMADWVCNTVTQLSVFIQRKAREFETIEKWQHVKDRFVDMFQEKHRLERGIRGFHQKVDNSDQADKALGEDIESKKDLIRQEECRKKQFERLKELEPRAYRGYSQEEYAAEVKELTYDQRIEKANKLIEKQKERSRGYGIER